MSIRISIAACFTAILSFLTGCSGMDIESFAGSEPRFVPEKVFMKTYTGNGLFFDRFGELKRKFIITISGEATSDKEFILKEDLTFDDGEKIKRNYRFVKRSDSTYEVFNEDLVGKAVVKSVGSALYWEYVLKTKVGDDTWNLSFSDWMFLRPDGTILNRAYASKWGLDVGQVFMSLSVK